MKLTCDLCGGALQMNLGGQDATCKSCGLVYSLARLQEKLGIGGAAPSKTPEAPTKPAVAKPEASQEQFTMQVDGVCGRYLTGRVQTGCIGIGETVYINGNESAPYRVYRFGDDIATVKVCAGMNVEIELNGCHRNILKQARTLIGDRTPGVNAYQFPGTLDAYFTHVLQQNFADYTLQTQVAKEGLRLPANYLLLKNGQPVVAIYVISCDDSSARYQAQKAVEIFGQAGIGCTHFYSEYRNDAQYVVDRIRSVMG